MLALIERLDQRIASVILRFIHRDGRAWVRRLMLVSVAIAIILSIGVGLMSLLLVGPRLGSEQAIMIAMIVVFTPAIVLHGSLFAARVH